MASDNLEIPITKLQWGLHGAQIFFAFLAMSCIAAVIAFDNKFMSASIISVAHIFIMIVSMFFAAAIVGIPQAYIQYGKLKSLARALRVPRIGFVLTAIWCFLLLIVSVAISIEVGLRNCDPTSSKYEEYNMGNNNETFIDGLAGNCRTERAGTAFGWFALAAWLGSLIVIGIEWRKNRRRPLPGNEEVTMHSNSTTSSLDISTTRPQQEQVQMQSVQPEHQTFSPGQQHQQPFQQPHQQPHQQHQQPHQQHQQPQDQGPSIHFPEPQHFS